MKIWIATIALLILGGGGRLMAGQVAVDQRTDQRSDQTADQRAPVQPTDYQLSLLGIQRTEVKKMNLEYKIQVAGRFMSSSRVAFQVYERDLRYIKIGTTFRGVSDIDPNDEVTGDISSIDSIVDPTSRTVRIVGALRSAIRGALTESEFLGHITVELKNSVAIPENSVLHTGESDLVYVFNDRNELKATEVKLGLNADGYYEVLNGVSPGQIISSGPNFLIDSEAKIQGVYSTGATGTKPTHPNCPPGQHWDVPMSMCMPGKG